MTTGHMVGEMSLHASCAYNNLIIGIIITRAFICGTSPASSGGRQIYYYAAASEEPVNVDRGGEGEERGDGGVGVEVRVNDYIIVRYKDNELWPPLLPCNQ